MSTMNVGSKSLLRACSFLLVALTHSFSLAQDPFDEIPKLQKRMDGLEAQIWESQGRFIASEELNPRQDNALMLLTHTSKNLNIINREFQALFQYRFLAGLITGKSATQYALGVVVDQRELLKKLNKVSIEVLEKTMHSAGDQETNRLLLEARDLFRSSRDLLDRLQVPETMAK